VILLQHSNPLNVTPFKMTMLEFKMTMLEFLQFSRCL
jgi:hypothetical protein